MYGDLSTFRHVPSNLSWMIFASPTNPMIVLQPDGVSLFHQTGEGKQIALGDVNREKDLVLRVRQGKMKSDVFHIRKEDLEILTPFPVNE